MTNRTKAADSAPQSTKALRDKLNLETAQVSWHEIQRHFARGKLIVVSSELDLIEVAARFAEDDKTSVDNWVKRGQVGRAHDEHAKHWQAGDAHFWAVVISPWVLVQEVTPD